MPVAFVSGHRHTGDFTTATPSFTCDWTGVFAPAAGEALLLVITAIGASTLTPPAGWSILRSTQAGSVHTWCLLKENCSAADLSVTIGSSAAANAAWLVRGYSGVKTSGVVDANGLAESAANITIASASCSTGSTGTLSQSNGLAIALAAIDSEATGTGGAWSGSFAEADTCFRSSGDSGIVRIAELLVSSLAPVSASYSGFSSDQNYGAMIVLYDVDPGATTPEITGPAGAAGDASIAINVAENVAGLGTWSASLPDGTWSVVAGADAASVAVGASTGVVTFVSGGENFEFPDDADENGSYLFTLQYTHANGNVTQAVTATLTNVNEPPGAPTIGTASAGNTTASVAFTTPAANGGPTPTSYTATSSPGGITGSGASSPIVVSGLTNGVEYTFTVTATTSEGTGPASAASNAVTPAAVTYSITSPAGGFAPNTGAGARAEGVTFNWWAFAGLNIGDSLTSATIQRGSGALNVSGRAVIPGLVLSGAWECQVRFADGGTARWQGNAV